MPYQVIARKWRPQKFDEVVGQRGVTQTLRNAITSDHISQAFIFSGPRGIGKTTTARILARALNCEKGPTPDPCGRCDACLEIAEGRDIDVLEIDGATHTGIDDVREVIVKPLSIAPLRDRYKVFLIDEAHQLSPQAFNALLKSIEEPPPHVVFMMATTKLDKFPDTILSRSQVFEFRTIGAAEIAGQLSRITTAEKIDINDDAVRLLAHAAEGSMRDAQTALDQVIAFASEHITADDVSTVLGLVGRDLLLDAVEAVADERASDLFELAGKFVESGYDLRRVCQELARVCRDLLVLTIDASRFDDPEIAPEGDRERLRALVQRFSREDLMRAFDVLSRAEMDIKLTSQPRYHLEMALLRWIQLRHLVPLAELIDGLESGAPVRRAGASDTLGRGRPSGVSASVTPRRSSSPGRVKADTPPAAPAKTVPTDTKATLRQAGPSTLPSADGAAGDLKSALLAEIKRTKKFFYGTVVAQAQRIVLDGDRITFTFAANHRTLQTQLEQSRPSLEKTASEIAGREIRVEAEQGAADAKVPTSDPTPTEASEINESLKTKVMDDVAVQDLLDVFPAKIRSVEEA